MLDDILFVGPTQEATNYISAFDVFLNTSIYEGLSIASMEAAQLNCPLVLSDVGGQRELITTGPCTLVVDDSDIEAYVRAIKSLPPVRATKPLAPPQARHLIPQLWSLIAEQAAWPLGPARADTLFVTSNLNPGGAQRSLINLLLGLNGRHACWLCVVESVLGDDFIDLIRTTTVGLIGLARAGSTIDKSHDVLVLASRLGVRNIVFWNLEVGVKLIIAKALESRPIQLIDVSPGPALFKELEAARDLQRRIAFSSDNYLDRLDHFVAKYEVGLTFESFCGRPRHSHIIRNGVAAAPPPSGVSKPLIRPENFDPQLALVTCCRIVPDKLIENLIERIPASRERWETPDVTGHCNAFGSLS